MKQIFRFSLLIFLISIVMTSCKKTNSFPINLGNEVDFSSPILQLGESWQGNMGGLIDVTTHYDTTTNEVYGTVKNVSAMELCWGLSEPHMKLGTQTVGELGPQKLGNLLPGEQINTSLFVLSDPRYTEYAFDGYVIHLEVYDCSGSAPPPY